MVLSLLSQGKGIGREGIWVIICLSKQLTTLVFPSTGETNYILKSSKWGETKNEICEYAKKEKAELHHSREAENPDILSM